MPRVYVEKKTEAAVLDALRLYGIKPEPAEDNRGRYYQWTVPDYWSEARRLRFSQAITLARLK